MRNANCVQKIIILKYICASYSSQQSYVFIYYQNARIAAKYMLQIIRIESISKLSKSNRKRRIIYNLMNNTITQEIKFL